LTVAYEIPLVPAPQTLSVTLGGTVYQLRLQWCEPAAAWTLYLAQPDGTPLLNGIQLVTGTDLLEQFAYLNLGGKLYVQTDHDADVMPTFENLGQRSHLLYVPL
jgi:hypothetical protein